ncbi:hypothetical protein [Bradyrhizobium sp. USDA 4516]
MMAKPERLIACVVKSGREEFRIALKDYNGSTKAELRIFERRRDGEMQSTPRHVVVGREYLVAVAEGLLRADALLAAEVAA